ncbi:MAG: sulfate ABC transporter permease subunit CysT [Solirubrobacterales bacterium]|nr:sulfate ABC transporter permease subunit CysT [Solirubrobacterales bacterium]
MVSTQDPAAGSLERARRRPLPSPGALAGLAFGGVFLAAVILLPLAAVAAAAFEDGFAEFFRAITKPQSWAALRFTLIASAAVTLINAVTGTLMAWVLVRDDFRGKRLVNAAIDLPFALPTIVAGLTLLALYGPNGPTPINVGFTQAGVVLALLFVTMPFVVRSVQPVLLAFDREMEDAAASLGAGGWMTFRRVIFPNLRGAMFAGCALSFGRALGEFGSIVLISGNLPFKTEVSSVYIFGQIENDNLQGAAAVSVLLLLAALLVIASIGFISRIGDHRA